MKDTVPLLRLQDLKAGYSREEEDHVLLDVDLEVHAGEFVGLVGESGSGKTTIARVLTGQLQPEEGQVLFRGQDLTRLRGRERRQAARGIQMVFQDPYSSLDPRMAIGKQIEEALIIHGERNLAARRAGVRAIMEEVGLAAEMADRLPASLSGGQRQRVAIAIAVVTRPALLLADEMTSALDVSVEAQILNLLQQLRQEHGFSCLFISHDLELVYYLCDRIAILREGRIIEDGPVEEVYRQPKEAYTRALVAHVKQRELQA